MASANIPLDGDELWDTRSDPAGSLVLCGLLLVLVASDPLLLDQWGKPCHPTFKAQHWCLMVTC